MCICKMKTELNTYERIESCVVLLFCCSKTLSQWLNFMILGFFLISIINYLSK